MSNIEKWNERDSLKVMTSKFNAAVEALENLQNTSTQVNEETQQRIESLQTQFTESVKQTTSQIMEELEDISDELAKKIESETANDIELEDSDINVLDLNRPVSIPQQEAIDIAKQEVLQVCETKITSEEVGSEITGEDDPEVTPQVKTYVEKMVLQALAGRDTAVQFQNNKMIINTPQPGMVGYDIANPLNLGVVKPSDDVEVDPLTGRMSVPELAALRQLINQVNTDLGEKLQTTIKGLQAVARDIGNIKALQTTEKKNLVGAINEILKDLANNS